MRFMEKVRVNVREQAKCGGKRPTAEMPGTRGPPEPPEGPGTLAVLPCSPTANN